MSVGPDPTGGGPQGVPSEEELRAAYEAELARITATDMIAQAAVSLLNIGARRIGPPPAPPGAAEAPPPGAERDLEQVRDSIDAATALLGILERRVPAEQLAPLRDALSRLQMAYSAEVRASGGGGEGGAGEGGAAQGSGGPGGDDSGDGDGDSGGDGGDSGEGGPGGPGGGGPPPPPGSGGEQGGAGQPRPGPGPAESSGRLWVPGT